MSKIIESVSSFVDELAHEKEMKALGKARTLKRRLSHIQREEESVTSYGKVMCANTIRPLAKTIVRYIDSCSAHLLGRPPVAFMKLCEVPPEILALICAKHIINTITQQKPFTASCIALGGKVETEIALKNFKHLNPELYSVVKEDLDKRSFNYNYKRRKLRESAKRDSVMQWEDWTVAEKLHTGIRLVEFMVVATGLIEISTMLVKRKRTKVIKPTDKTREWIRNRNNFNELLNPEYLPTILPPKNWEENTSAGGGYWTKELPELDLVKQKNKEFKREIENAKMPEVYSALNIMQNTAFCINSFILSVMQTAWDSGIALGGIPSNENLTIPNKPHDIETNKRALKQWKKEAVIIHTENARLFSKRLLYAKIIWEAQKFKDYKTIYFPLQLDFRGRVYCIPAFLNYQSVGGAKALLNFAKGKEITEENRGAFWLAVHGCNMFGNDKISLHERVEWVADNEDWIFTCAVNPLENRQWEQASSPFQFLAFCDEWKRFREEGYGFVSSLPVSVDGSCNGLQLYSLMLRDKRGGALVNLVPSEKPNDIYQLVADAVVEKLKELESEGCPLAKQWLRYGVKRSTTKRAIMTICYGSTRYSTTDFVIEDLTKRKDKGELNPFIKDLFKPATYLAGLIWESIGDNLKSARLGMQFLQQIAKIVAKEQLPIRWTNAVGFPVRQFYPEMKSKRVKAMLFGQVIKPRIKTESDKTDKLRMSNGIAPNLIHGTDSACQMRNVNLAYKSGIRNFCNVHDSFGTTCADMEVLTKCIKESFISIFSKTDVLEDFKKTVEGQLPNEILKRKLPKELPKGDLNIDELRKCDFFFA